MNDYYRITGNLKLYEEIIEMLENKKSNYDLSFSVIEKNRYDDKEVFYIYIEKTDFPTLRNRIRVTIENFGLKPNNYKYTLLDEIRMW